MNYPSVGDILTWKQVETEYKGEKTFLSKRDGRIVCATLDMDKNPCAPDIMVVGSKPKNKRRAEEYCNQKTEIPVFLRLSSNRWKYAGQYIYASHTTDPLRLKEWQSSRTDPLSRVIFLRASGTAPNSFVDITIDVSATEGARKLYRHQVRERNRGLKKAKIQQYLAIKGNLNCEACNFSFENRYGSHGKNVCEVHHNVLLSSRVGEVITTLSDLSILCSNCHTVIHRISPMPLVSKFKTILKKH
jgi:predicted HNH restriction endonuclease